MSKQKRKDLQGLRGLAIIVVLLFHFVPTVFKNGYVGVDQFFILSGYLMAVILSREREFSLPILLSFYYRRMKRLLPLYALCILLTLIASLTIFPAKTFKFNSIYAVKSLLFVSNLHREDASLTYERMVADAKILFTHTWSLSVEIQFYVMAPFIILSSLWMNSAFYSMFLCLIYAISYFFFNYLFFWVEAEDLAFNSVFTRIWQFSLGIICAHYTTVKLESNQEDKQRLLEESDEADEIETNSEISSLLSHLVLVSIILLIMFPLEVSSGLVRILICLQTSGLIIAGTRMPNWFLSQSVLVYLGDISYSLYLVHWPVYVYFSNKELNDQYVVLGPALSILLAIILTEFYEKFYLSLEKKYIIILCSNLYIANFILIIVYSSSEISTQELNWESEFIVPENFTKELAMKINKNFTDQDAAKLTIPECTYKEGGSWNLCTFNNSLLTGNKTVLIIGNSYATNFARMLIRTDECTIKAKDMYLYGQPSCEVLEDTTSIGYGWCKDKNAVFLNTVKEHKPNYLFLLTRHLTSMQNPLPVPLDRLYEEAKKRLLDIEQSVHEKIFLLNAIPRPYSDLTQRVNNGLEQGIMVEESSLIESSANYNFARNFTETLVKSCLKCQLIDIMPIFTINGQFNVYNSTNGLIYFSDSLHLTDYGLDKVKPMFSQLCRTLI